MLRAANSGAAGARQGHSHGEEGGVPVLLFLPSSSSPPIPPLTRTLDSAETLGLRRLRARFRRLRARWRRARLRLCRGGAVEMQARRPEKWTIPCAFPMASRKRHACYASTTSAGRETIPCAPHVASRKCRARCGRDDRNVAPGKPCVAPRAPKQAPESLLGLRSVRATGFGFRASGYVFRFSGFGFRASGFGFRASDVVF